MENYSKSKLVRKRGEKSLIIILAVILVIIIALAILILANNNIVKEKVNFDATSASDDIAKNSTPIVVNNLVVGATYNGNWVSAERYYLKSINKNGLEIDLFSKNGKLGTYELNEVTQKAGTTSVYTTTTRANLVDEYFAVSKNTINSIPSISSKEATDEDYKAVKKALGIYRLLNTSVKIENVYEVMISDAVYGKVIVASNEAGESSGAYTAVIFVDNSNHSSIIKYNYIRNLKKSSDWPIYSVAFIADLNNDSSKELVLIETKEFEAKYDILEYRNGKFVEVLSAVVK